MERYARDLEKRQSSANEKDKLYKTLQSYTVHELRKMISYVNSDLKDYTKMKKADLLMLMTSEENRHHFANVPHKKEKIQALKDNIIGQYELVKRKYFKLFDDADFDEFQYERGERIAKDAINKAYQEIKSKDAILDKIPKKEQREVVKFRNEIVRELNKRLKFFE